MPAEDIATTFRRVWDGVWHSKEAASVIAESYTNDFAMHIAPVPAPLDKATFTGFVANWQKAFPDGRMEILDVTTEGDKVWCYWVSTGTHSDTYLDIPATGRKVEYQGFAIFRFFDGNAAAGWDLPAALRLR